MRHFLYALLLLSMGSLSTNAQCPSTNLGFSVQAQIDQFGLSYPNCHNIEGSLSIQGSGIYNLDGLLQLQSIGTDLYLTSTDSLTNTTGLKNIQNIGGIARIQNNAALTSLGLSGLTILHGDYFYISDNPKLQNMDGLAALDSVGGLFRFWENHALTEIHGLANLSYVGDNVAIFKNDALLDLQGLENLTVVAGDLRVTENPNLQSLSGLSNNLQIQGALVITDNPMLSTCAVNAICNYLEMPASFIAISNNATGCSSTAEITALCTSSAADNIPESVFSIYPNPTDGMLYFSKMPGAVRSAFIRNVTGQIVLEQQGAVDSLDLSGLEKGYYILEVLMEEGRFLERVFVQ